MHGTSTICIIGAGPVGLAALKVVLDSPQYKSGSWIPTVFESRSDIGGVWLPSDTATESPLYDSLTTNIPHPVMAYSSFSFPPSTPLFPKANVVLDYLHGYVDHFNLRPYIQFDSCVECVEWENSKWRVSVNSCAHLFDLLIVCNGHYRLPRYPSTPGLDTWLSSGLATHSSSYRNPEAFKLREGDTVLVVGGGPSGQDVATDIASRHVNVVLSAEPKPGIDVKGVTFAPRVVQFSPPTSTNSRTTGTVAFSDNTTLTSVSHCILATGYRFSFPFLQDPILLSGFPPSPSNSLPSDLYNTTYSLFPLARHIWPIPNHAPLSSSAYSPHTLAFLGLPIRTAPLPLAESQARAVLAVFEDPRRKLQLEKESEQVWERLDRLGWQGRPNHNGTEEAEIGASQWEGTLKAYHRFELALEQFDYRDELFELFSSPSPPDLTSTSTLRGEYTTVPQWEKSLYLQKNILRKAWRKVESLGDEEVRRWVWGVGSKGGDEGKLEWVEMCEKLIEWYEGLEESDR
ncbi:hypothetical protein H0H93_005292 [Arthromyces matolae]|nr:hypothetical protein H0H93_005292 [Arthromyces matolae]